MTKKKISVFEAYEKILEFNGDAILGHDEGFNNEYYIVFTTTTLTQPEFDIVYDMGWEIYHIKHFPSYMKVRLIQK